MPTRRKAAPKPRKAPKAPKPEQDEEKALEPEVLAAEEPEALPEADDSKLPVPVERDRSIGRSRHQRVHIVRIVAHAKRSRQSLARRPQRPLFIDRALHVDFVIDVGIDIDIDIITAETGIEAVCFCFG